MAGGVVTELFDIVQTINGYVQKYKGAALGIRTVATQCTSYRIAVVRVTKWLATQTEASQAELEPDFWLALRENLETGASVIMCLEQEVGSLTRRKKLGFGSKATFVFNSESIALFQNQMQSLMLSISMLITVIDMPNLEAKKSQLEAQKPRLKTISKSVKESEAKREELRARYPVNMLIDLDVEETTSEASQPSTLQSCTTESRADQSRSSTTDTVDTSVSSASDVSQNVSENTRTVLYQSPFLTPKLASSAKSEITITSTTEISNEEWSLKPYTEPRGKWLKMFGRTKSDQLLPRTKSQEVISQSITGQHHNDHSRSVSQERRIHSPPMTEHPLVVSPQPIQIIATANQNESRTRSDQLEYFHLQQAMSGMSFGPGVANVANHTTYAEPPQPQQSPPPPPLPPQPRKQPVSELESTQVRLQTEDNVNAVPRNGPREKKRPVYGMVKATSETNLLRIRPSQRVASTRNVNDELYLNRASPAQTPPPPPYSVLSRSVSAEDSLMDLESEQVWATNTISDKESKFKVRFNSQAFTNKMSRAAARSLGVENHAIHYGDQAVVNLTLLYLTDGEFSSVVGEEVEFELLSEFSTVGSTFVLGAAQLHLRQIMAEGEYVYWNPGPIPEKLRDQNRLRILRRFELIRW